MNFNDYRPGNYVQFSERGKLNYGPFDLLSGFFQISDISNTSCTVVDTLNKERIYTSIDPEGDLLTPITLDSSWIYRFDLQLIPKNDGVGYAIELANKRYGIAQYEGKWIVGRDGEVLTFINHVHELQNLFLREFAIVLSAENALKRENLNRK